MKRKEVCPTCGARFTRNKSNRVLFWLLGTLAFLIIAPIFLRICKSVLTVGVPPSPVGEYAEQPQAVNTNGVQSSSALAEQEKMDYIKNHVEIFDLNARYFNSVSSGVTGRQILWHID